MPESIPKLGDQFLKNLSSFSFPEMSFEIAKNMLGDDIPEKDLRRIVEDAINFDTPLHSLSSHTHILELWHGPTLAFKDVGARFMSRLLGYFLKDEKQKVTVLVATSGDTGSAVANGFLNVPGIDVIILYPKGKVSVIQEKQLTTLGGNIRTLEVNGTFDDCQALVKQAFVDNDLKGDMNLTSANSINFARLFPQSFYYFNSYAQLKDERPLAFVVPSGNFGNLTAGLFAWKMGLAIDHFVAACNVNDVVPKYLANGVYQPRKSTKTVSNAMDVGDPSNFSRMLEIFNHNHSAMAEKISGYSFRDDQTLDAIQEIFQTYRYLMDPHGAVAYLATKEFLNQNRDYNCVLLETAHPIKFSEVVEEKTGSLIPVPERLKDCLNKEKVSIEIEKDYISFKEIIRHL